MSISSALTSALSGLNVASRNAEVVSGNVANAMTEGYGRRELQRTTQVLDGVGGGVRVAGVLRHADLQLLDDRRAAEAGQSGAGLVADFQAAAERMIGTPDQPGSLGARLASFEASLISAASRPDSTARLETVARAAADVAGKLNGATDALQRERMRADAAIASGVETLNDALRKLQDINGEIARLSSSRRDTGALVDQQHRLVDRIAELVPVRVAPRDHGRIALYSEGGAILLDGRAAQFGFNPAGVITADMSLAGGTLSGLTLNGRPLAAASDSGPIAGGRLAALFDVRDVHAPGVQGRLDAVARDLAERLADPAGDPSLTAGDPGVFTDGAGAFLAANETGFAGRIALNPVLDPAAGELWRLRDGIAATGPGDAGDARILQSRLDTLTAARTPASGGFGVAPRSAAGLASDLVSGIAAARQDAEDGRSFMAAQAETLRTMQLRDGVDTDAELQLLMQVEQAFAANARVLTTLDELLQMMVRI